MLCIKVATQIDLHEQFQEHLEQGILNGAGWRKEQVVERICRKEWREYEGISGEGTD